MPLYGGIKTRQLAGPEIVPVDFQKKKIGEKKVEEGQAKSQDKIIHEHRSRCHLLQLGAEAFKNIGGGEKVGDQGQGAGQGVDRIIDAGNKRENHR